MIRSILHKTYASHARAILAERQTLGTPPFSCMALLRTDARSAEVGEEFLSRLRKQAQQQLPRGTTLIGPLPSPMQRRAGKYRSQLLLTATSRQAAQTAATVLVACAEKLTARQLNWTIDIDPQDSF